MINYEGVIPAWNNDKQRNYTLNLGNNVYIKVNLRLGWQISVCFTENFLGNDRRECLNCKVEQRRERDFVPMFLKEVLRVLWEWSKSKEVILIEDWEEPSWIH